MAYKIDIENVRFGLLEEDQRVAHVTFAIKGEKPLWPSFTVDVTTYVGPSRGGLEGQVFDRARNLFHDLMRDLADKTARWSRVTSPPEE